MKRITACILSLILLLALAPAAWAASAGQQQDAGAAFQPHNPTRLHRNAVSPVVPRGADGQEPTAPAADVSLADLLQVSGDSVVFSALPENAAEMEEVLEEWRSNEKAVAALFIEALAIYAMDPDAALPMMDVLVGGSGMSTYDQRTLASRMSGKEAYLPFSYFDGAVQSNGYEPTEPYTVTVIEQSNSRDEAGYIKVFIPSGGADSARPIKLRQEDGGWYVHEYSSILLDIRRPTVQQEDPAAAASESPFTDVQEGDYFYDAVLWASDAGVTSGATETTFDPGATCTRGQAVTFLWRSLGRPQPTSEENPFTDVSADMYYYQAVLWAVEHGVTAGTTPTTFAPNDTCTSAQVLTFLHRTNDQPAAQGASSLAATYPGQYYTSALAWAESTGLLQGVGAAFQPDNPSPRADIVTYLYRNAGSPAISQEADGQEPEADETDVSLADLLQVSGDSVIFSALPENADEMEAVLEEWRSNEKAVAALFIEALAIYAMDPDAAFPMMDVLVGGMSRFDQQTLTSRMRGKEAYLPFSYFDGAVQSNGYEPTEPYTVTVIEQSNSRNEEGYIKVFIPSGGADSARPIKLRQEDGGWYVHEYSSILLDIRKPTA